MLRFVKRNLRQAGEALRRAEQEINKHGHANVKKAEKLLATIEKLVEQQQEVYARTRRDGSKKGIRIQDRIVSIYRSYVRPISRGKIPVPVEFGPKILLEMRSGFIRLLKTSYKNTADSEMVKEHFENWNGLILGGDRGFHSPENSRIAMAAGVKKYFVEKKGKRAHPKSAALKRVRGKRAAIEASISLAKRQYGLNRILYGRGAEGEEQWIRLGITAMNLNRVLRLT